MQNNQDFNYPSYLKQAGAWPINMGLFFLYNTIINIFLGILVSIIFTARGITDTTTILEKTKWLGLIGIILTLGITILFKKLFYVLKKIPEQTVIPFEEEERKEE
jgi:hypothetical protein